MSASASPSRDGFDSFGLHPSLSRGVRAAGFGDPRPIQSETIPAGLDGRDVLGLAQTGTGKTAAFALPLLDQLLDERRPGPRALVLAPTRELASQIAAEIRTLAKFTNLKMVTVYGGVPMRAQVAGLRKRPEIVVGCPGRVLDLLGQGVLRTSARSRPWCSTRPTTCSTWASCRTSGASSRRCREEAPEPALLGHDAEGDPPAGGRSADTSRTWSSWRTQAPAETIEHALYPWRSPASGPCSSTCSGGDDCDSAIVFIRTKHRARRLADQLSREAGHRAVALQGNMSQGQRDRAMRGFRDRRYDILVATDIAARGIDVSGVSHVINFDVPGTPQAYTHRIGRTGRSEREGVARTFVTGGDRDWVRATERMIGKPIPLRRVEGFESEADEERPRSQRRPRRRSPRGGRGRSRRR